jgi:putative tricarboxylic transport membrane protein
MDNLNLLLDGFSSALSAQNLMYGLLGTFLGTLVGVLPGIGPALAIALLL